MKRFLSDNMLSICLLALAVAIPGFTGQYVTSILVLIAIWSITSIALNLLYGYTGQLSLGHSAFLGIGAYAFGLLAVKMHMGFWPAFFGATVISGISGVLIGIPALRLRGPHFVLVTLGFAAIVAIIILAWVDLTGGANGIAGMPRPNAIPLPWGAELRFDSLISMYYFILFFLVLIALICHRIVHSLPGKIFIAISENENLVTSLGVRTMTKKLLSFTISAIFTGVAGALYASYNGVISPDLANIMRGMDILTYLIVGGAGTIMGPIVGTIVLMALPEILQIVPSLKTLINGIVLLLFVIFCPAGIVNTAAKYFRRRPSPTV